MIIFGVCFMRCVYSLKRVKDKGGEDIGVQQKVIGFSCFYLAMDFLYCATDFLQFLKNQAVSPSLWSPGISQ